MMDTELGDEEADFDFDNGFQDRLRSAYDDWCQTYEEEFNASRMELFSHHFMLAEKYSRMTGEKVKLNHFAGLTEPEIGDILAIIGGGTTVADDIERPMGAEFLDYAYELEEESSFPTSTTTDTIDRLPSRDRSDKNNDSFGGSNSHNHNHKNNNVDDDKIARATNAFLETADKDSIIPPTESNLFKPFNVENSMLEENEEESTAAHLGGNKNEDEPTEEAVALDHPIFHEQNEVPPTDVMDEETLMFLSYVDSSPDTEEEVTGETQLQDNVVSETDWKVDDDATDIDSRMFIEEALIQDSAVSEAVSNWNAVRDDDATEMNARMPEVTNSEIDIHDSAVSEPVSNWNVEDDATKMNARMPK
ncbi:MAG: hypothetical protein SGBAC_012200, partial [Bacillariaceae sp.]